METKLHQQLKVLYAGMDDAREVRVDGFRIDAIRDGELIEVQLGSLSAIRDKIRKLLQAGHRVRLVKPLIQNKRLIRLAEQGGKVVSSRRSPKSETIVDLFHHLVHFSRVFPHPLLTLEVPWISVEETRYPGHGKRRRWREKDFLVEELRLVELHRNDQLRSATDLLHWLAVPLPPKFHTGELARLLKTQRWIAQRIAYCLRQCGAAEIIEKQGNTHIYRPLRLSVDEEAA